MANRYKNINTKFVRDSRIPSRPPRALYNTVFYPEIPLSISDIYVTSTDGDRWDVLAQQYYGDSTLWWLISIANDSLNQSSLYVTPGIQIRIPSNPEVILQQFRDLNT